jgi:hypothetical protein
MIKPQQNEFVKGIYQFSNNFKLHCRSNVMSTEEANYENKRHVNFPGSIFNQANAAEIRKYSKNKLPANRARDRTRLTG